MFNRDLELLYSSAPGLELDRTDFFLHACKRITCLVIVDHTHS